MTEWKTMRVPEDAWAAAQKARGEDETWGDYLRRCADEPRIEMTEDQLRKFVQEQIRQQVVQEALR